MLLIGREVELECQSLAWVLLHVACTLGIKRERVKKTLSVRRRGPLCFPLICFLPSSVVKSTVQADISLEFETYHILKLTWLKGRV